MFVLQQYDTDKIKIILAIIGICSLAVGLAIFFYFYLILSNMMLGLTFLGVFIIATIIFLILAIFQQFRSKPKYYWGPTSNLNQRNPMPNHFYNRTSHYTNNSTQRQFGNWWQYSNFGNTNFQRYGSNIPNLRGNSFSHNCPSCNNQIKYANEYQRWYCESCRQWI